MPPSTPLFTILRVHIPNSGKWTYTQHHSIGSDFSADTIGWHLQLSRLHSLRCVLMRTCCSVARVGGPTAQERAAEKSSTVTPPHDGSTNRTDTWVNPHHTPAHRQRATLRQVAPHFSKGTFELQRCVSLGHPFAGGIGARRGRLTGTSQAPRSWPMRSARPMDSKQRSCRPPQHFPPMVPSARSWGSNRDTFCA